MEIVYITFSNVRFDASFILLGVYVTLSIFFDYPHLLLLSHAPLPSLFFSIARTFSLIHNSSAK